MSKHAAIIFEFSFRLPVREVHLGRNVITASADHTLKMWNFYGNVLRTYAGHPSEVLPPGCRGCHFLWQVITTHPMLFCFSDVAIARVSQSILRCVDVDWKNHRMISGSLASDLKMWRLDSSTPLRSFNGSGVGTSGSCLTCLRLQGYHAFASRSFAMRDSESSTSQTVPGTRDTMH